MPQGDFPGHVHMTGTLSVDRLLGLPGSGGESAAPGYLGQEQFGNSRRVVAAGLITGLHKLHSSQFSQRAGMLGISTSLGQSHQLGLVLAPIVRQPR